MTTSQRAAARFFSAFYRYNSIYTRHTSYSQCASISLSNGFRPRHNGLARAFATSRACGQTGAEAVQMKVDVFPEEEAETAEEHTKQEERRPLASSSATTQPEPQGPSQPTVDTIASSAASAAHTRAEVVGKTLRHVMRHVPYPVVVVTAAAPESHEGEPLGSAVSSFNSVSMDPPIVSFNIRRPSQTLDAIVADDGRFRVHIMASDPLGAFIVDSFTKGNTSAAYDERKRLARMDTSDTVFSRAARIKGGSVFASLRCKVVDVLPVADHVIIAARVAGIDTNPVSSSTALVYVHGKYIQSNVETLIEHGQQYNDTSERHILYDRTPLFVGLRCRSTIQKEIETYFLSNRELHKLPPAEITDRVCSELALPQYPLGLRIPLIVRDAARQAKITLKYPDDLPHRESPKFYGRLMPRNIDYLKLKATRHAARNVRWLNKPWYEALLSLGIAPNSTGFLAGEIMQAVRDDGLAPPLEEDLVLKHIETPTLQHLEVVERHLRSFFLNYPHGQETHAPVSTWTLSTTQLCEQLEAVEQGEWTRAKWAKDWIAQVRTLVHVHAFPDFHKQANYELVGELNKNRTQIAADRIRRFLVPADEGLLEERMELQWWEVCREAGVHPYASGFDPILLVDRFKWFYRQEKDRSKDMAGSEQQEGEWARKYQERVSELYRDFFQDSVTLNSLRDLVQRLVRVDVEAATTFRGLDLLVALGLKENARYVRKAREGRAKGEKGVVEGPEVGQPVAESHLVSLLRTSMRDVYGIYTPEQRKMVDRFLNDESLAEHEPTWWRATRGGLPGKQISFSGRKSGEERQVGGRDMERGTREGASTKEATPTQDAPPTFSNITTNTQPGRTTPSPHAVPVVEVLAGSNPPESDKVGEKALPASGIDVEAVEEKAVDEKVVLENEGFAAQYGLGGKKPPVVSEAYAKLFAVMGKEGEKKGTKETKG